MTKKLSAIIFTLFVLCSNSNIFAQGFLNQVRTRRIVRPAPRPILPPIGTLWTINYHKANIKVRDQIASVSVDQQFENVGSGMIEVEYLFPVPSDAAIDSMTLVVNGKEFKAQLLKADEARKIYEDIVRQKKDPALLQYVGYNLYKTSAFPLEVGKPANIQITYKVICKKDSGSVEVFYPMSGDQFSSKEIKEVKIVTDIKSKNPLAGIYSPTNDVNIQQAKPNQAIVTYEAKNVTTANDFILYYNQTGEDIAASIITHQPQTNKDGYFLLMLSPNVHAKKSEKQKATPKDIVLVIDTSGSMVGEKFTQATDALKYALEKLNPQDRFNIVAYSDSVNTFYKSMKLASKENIKKAIEDLDRISASGGTNINDALKTAMSCFQEKIKVDGKEVKNNRPKYLIFMTDGQATVGELSLKGIVDNCKKANKLHARLFTFGVGFRANVRLLDMLVQTNRGKSDYVKPKQNIEKVIASLCNKIQNPVMTNLKIEIDGIKLSQVYPQIMPDLFKGDQIVLAGRYDPRGLAKFPTSKDGDKLVKMKLTGMYLGETKEFTYTLCIKSNADRPGYDFVDSLWATRRVGFLMDQIQVNQSNNKEIIDELIRLSVQYGIITPYTSFLADERNVGKSLESDKIQTRAKRSVEQAKNDSGAGGMSQNAGKMRKQLKDASKAKKKNKPKMSKGYIVTKGTTMTGNTNVKDYENDNDETVRNVVNLGNQTVYLKGKIMIASNARDLDLVKDKNKIKNIIQFSKEYFALVNKANKSERVLLSNQLAGTTMILRVSKQAYRVTPQKDTKENPEKSEKPAPKAEAKSQAPENAK